MKGRADGAGNRMSLRRARSTPLAAHRRRLGAEEWVSGRGLIVRGNSTRQDVPAPGGLVSASSYDRLDAIGSPSRKKNSGPLAGRGRRSPVADLNAQGRAVSGHRDVPTTGVLRVLAASSTPRRRRSRS